MALAARITCLNLGLPQTQAKLQRSYLALLAVDSLLGLLALGLRLRGWNREGHHRERNGPGLRLEREDYERSGRRITLGIRVRRLHGDVGRGAVQKAAGEMNGNEGPADVFRQSTFRRKSLAQHVHAFRSFSLVVSVDTDSGDSPSRSHGRLRRSVGTSPCITVHLVR